MRVAMFYHSLVSDWNHGNAHFLRGVVRELLARGHAVEVFEPRHGWSRQHLLAEQGPRALERFAEAFPGLGSTLYDLERFDLDAALDGVDLAIVHEWSDRELVRRVGRHRAQHGGYRLLFHDTHHRSVTCPEEMAAYDLSGFDGVLAFGAVVRALYLARGWCQRAWVWHEAADTRLFRPPARPVPTTGDVVWIGNWGDEERTTELHSYLLEPVVTLRLRASCFGVRYPAAARAALALAGMAYGGWLPNAEVPAVFARHRVTVHVPRRPYAQALPGIPTIRPFEALACGIPLICAPWDDIEGLFRPGADYLVARSGADMQRHLRSVLAEPALAAELSASGLERIRSRHTCAHRVTELLGIAAELGLSTEPEQGPCG